MEIDREAESSLRRGYLAGVLPIFMHHVLEQCATPDRFRLSLVARNLSALLQNMEELVLVVEELYFRSGVDDVCMISSYHTTSTCSTNMQALFNQNTWYIFLLLFLNKYPSLIELCG